MKTLKGWGIALSAYEKRSLARFLVIYLGSMYLFIGVLGWMATTLQVRNLHENHALQLRSLAASVSHNIVTAHMMGEVALPACLEEGVLAQCFELEEGFALALYRDKTTPVAGSFLEAVDFSREFYFHNDAFYTLDQSARGHLGVQYVVVKEEGIARLLGAVQRSMGLWVGLSLAFATGLGVVLARLFLKPIKEEIAHLDRFIKDSTHELNTPITAILMSIRSLGEVEEKKRKRLELSARRIATLYGNLSYMLLHDKTNEEKTTVDVHALVEERLDYFGDFIASKKLHCKSDLAPVSLHVNHEGMVKLIDNLLSNAIKYNRVGGSLTLALTSKGLTISDTGVGITPKDLPHILKRYKRANSDKGGFGIGLDIVNTICQTNGFTLHIASKENEGSVFEVVF